MFTTHFLKEQKIYRSVIRKAKEKKCKKKSYEKGGEN